MAASSLPSAARLAAGVTALQAAREAVTAALKALKARATVDGKLSGALLDAAQLVSFELAWSTAELTAAEAALAHADRAREARKLPPEPPAPGGVEGLLLEERLALAFTAEAIQNTRTRLSGHPSDFGLDRALLAATLEAPTTLDFLDAQLGAASLAGLGELIRTQQGSLGSRLLPPDAEMMRQTFKKFAEEVVKPQAEHIHRHDADVPQEILSALIDLGAFGLSIPQRYGGFTADEPGTGPDDTLNMIVVTEELSRGSLGAAGSLITRPEIVTRALLAGGTEEQRAFWLPKFAAGERLPSVAVTEPDYGSDVAGMRFKAARTTGGWLLNGTKSWCTLGGRADVLLVLARTDPDLSRGHRGLSLFLVEKPRFDGHEFHWTSPAGGTLNGRAIPTIGYRGMHSFEVFFEDVFVPDSHLIGGEGGLGKGFYFQMAGFSGGRIQTAARALGVMQAAFEAALTYANDRKVFGAPIADYELTRVKLARMGAQIAAGRALAYAVGRQMDEGGGQMEASLVKLLTCRQAEGVTREATQIHGGMGYAEETAVSRYFLDARVLSIFEGAEEVLALKVIARALVEAA